MYVCFLCLKVRNEEERTTREGLCSHHLGRVTPGELVRVTIRPSSFRAPKDLAASPVIMVRVGAGPEVEVDWLEIELIPLRF